MTTTAHDEGQGSSPLNNRVALPTDATELLDAILEHRGWAQREGQVMMVESIADALATALPGRDVDIAVNAPVGTGKTLAYILSALARGERIVIATSTKGLQDQIVGEELPKLREDLAALYGYELTYGVLKGKSNYGCMATARLMLDGGKLGGGDEEDEDLFEDVADLEPDSRDLDTIRELVESAESAIATRDIARYDSEHLIRRLLPATRTQLRASKKCGGKNRAWIAGVEGDKEGEEEWTLDDWPQRRAAAEQAACTPSCVYRAAYAHCMTAQVVVLNTTLLVYEIMKANSNMFPDTPVLLEGAGVLVVDEAHHLARILAEAYSLEVDFGNMLDTTREVMTKLERRYDESVLGNVVELTTLMESTEQRVAEVVDDNELGESALRTGISAALTTLYRESTSRIALFISRVAEQERAAPSGKKVNRQGIPRTVGSLIYTLQEEVLTPLEEGIRGTSRRNSHQELVNHLTFLGAPGEPLSIKIVPVDVSFFREDISGVARHPNYYIGPPDPAPRSAVIMSSGTITAETPQTVGMDPGCFVNVPSPFDPKRARLFVPELPEPREQEWVEQAWECTKRAINVVGGRTLLLTTSRAKLDEFAALAREELDVPVLSQSDGLSKRELVERFREQESSILVGTTSFWEGVDVPGSALSLVVLDKVPFPTPNDPIFEARRRWVEKHDGNPFMKVDVDHASIMMAQGAGRLIRAVEDVGAVMILDSRVVTKRYGAQVLRLLPGEWPLTRSEEAFHEWLQWVNPDTRSGPLPVPDLDEWRPLRPQRHKRRRIS